MMLLAECKGERTLIKLVCDECGGLLQEDFDGACGTCLTCERCGYVLEVSRAIEFIETVQSEMRMLLETLREAERTRPKA